jgi:hypothetical protein
MSLLNHWPFRGYGAPAFRNDCLWTTVVYPVSVSTGDDFRAVVRVCCAYARQSSGDVIVCPVTKDL